MVFESTTDNFQIRNADKITFVGTSNTMIDTTTGRIQANGFQNGSEVILDLFKDDHSIDTVITSKFTGPDNTGVRVLVDGLLETGVNQIEMGPDPNGNHVTYDSYGKYWILNGTNNSNISVESNTFIADGKAHSVSLWFKSSNLEANVSNTCIIGIGSEIKINTDTVDIESNIWHNLTYTSQGSGGSKIIYLDGNQFSNTETNIILPGNTNSIQVYIGGGNIDKIANFRIYDRFIEQYRVMEIWDAYKDYFDRVKSHITVHRGNIGIGLNNPQSRLSILDNPTIIEKFPPMSLSSYDEMVPGHGHFKTSASSSNIYTVSYNAFNNAINTAMSDHVYWLQGGSGDYDILNGNWLGGSINALTTTNVEGVNRFGQWIQLEFPYKVSYSYSTIRAPRDHIGIQPHTGCIVGSNDVHGIWTILDDFSGKTRSDGNDFVTYRSYRTQTECFKYIRIVIEKLNGGSSRAGIETWNIYANREKEQSTIDNGIMTLSHKLDVRGDLYYTGMICNLEYMENIIRSWNPHYWWDVDDSYYLEGGLNEGDEIKHVHNKSGNWVDNYLTATDCVTRYINGRRFWTGGSSSSRMVSRDKNDFNGNTHEEIGDMSSIFHVACTSPIHTSNSYYHDSITIMNRNYVTWDNYSSDLTGGELLFYNGDGYGYSDNNSKTAGGVLGVNGPTTTERAVHCVMTKANSSFNREDSTRIKGINNHISIATLTRGALTMNLANVTSNPGTNTSDAIVWGNNYLNNKHNHGNFFYGEMIVFKRNRGVISQTQVKFLQDYFRFKYQTGGIGLQYPE